MKISQFAKQLSACGDRDSIRVIQTLLLYMKKFGKTLVHPSVIDCLKKEQPDVLRIYRILGGSRLSIAQCQQLLILVSQQLSYNHLEMMSPVDVLFSPLQGDGVHRDTLRDVGLSVIGKGKVYKRTLEGDLRKMMNSY